MTPSDRRCPEPKGARDAQPLRLFPDGDQLGANTPGPETSDVEAALRARIRRKVVFGQFWSVGADGGDPA